MAKHVIASLGRILFIIAVVLYTAAGPLYAQTPDFDPDVPRVKWSLNGDLGTVGELYRMNGRPGRRPNEFGRMFLRSTATLAELYTIRAELLLSTEGRSALASHSLNQFMINPSWRWRNTDYSARIGDFSDAYTPYTFNGVRVRGGELDVQRSGFQATLLGGRTSPPFVATPGEGRFTQTMVAGRLGYGEERGSATIFFLYARDDEGTPDVLPDTTDTIDSTEVGTVINPFAVTPQENFVVAAWGNLKLLDNQLDLTGELSHSAYARDRRAAEAGSRLTDYAVDTRVRYKRDRYALTGGYRRIGPGYVSVGVASMHSDQQEFRAEGSYGFGSLGAIRILASRQNDNLADQKRSTTVRYRAVSDLSLRPTRKWTASFSTNYVTMANDISNDSLRVDFDAWIFATSQIFTFGHVAKIQSTSLNYTYQTSGDDNPLRQNSDVASHNLNARFMMRVTRNLTVTPLIGFINTQIAGQGWQRTDTFAAALSHRAMLSKMTNTLSSSISFSDTGNLFRNILGSRYALTPSDSIVLRVTIINFHASNNATASGGTYDEFAANLGWTHRF